MTEFETETQPAEATPGSAGSKGIWVGGILLTTSVAFVALAGCFLMGAFMLAMDPPPWLPSGTRPGKSFWIETLSVILYIFAFGCGLCAMALLFLGTRTLLRAARS